MRIDVHAHYWTEDYLDLIADMGRTDTGAQRGLGAGGGEELEARLRLMDRAGVDMQILSASPNCRMVRTATRRSPLRAS
jgi:6-methylsalicylate decarboxylase